VHELKTLCISNHYLVLYGHAHARENDYDDHQWDQKSGQFSQLQADSQQLVCLKLCSMLYQFNEVKFKNLEPALPACELLVSELSVDFCYFFHLDTSYPSL